MGKFANILVRLFCILPFLAILIAHNPVAAQSQAKRGMQLFVHNWRPNDPLARGDGLGPLFNENSCLKCHFRRSPGGAGDLEQNIQLISAVPRVDDDTPEAQQRARTLLGTLHPSFVVGPQLEDGAEGPPNVRKSIVLHRHDVNPGYADFRAALLGRSPGNLPIFEQGAVESHLRVLVNAAGVAWIVSERNSPALFGDGLIDRLPGSLLHQTASRQPANVKGIVPILADGRVGRFGWRGQSPSLQDFVTNAFAVELGLSNDEIRQEPSPLLQPPQQPPRSDVTLQQIQDVTAFIASLPQPKFEAGGALEQQRMSRGRGLFTSIGCADCHQRHLGSVRNIFSDLLLHDMGPELADPVPGPNGVAIANQGNQTTPPTQAQSGPSAGAYAGASSGVFEPVRPENLRLWRTPPLWGVADSAPYLHDGRAGTLRRAILLHGGQGLQSSNRFFGLSEESQADVVFFLSSLRAPQLLRQEAAQQGIPQ